MTIIELPRHTSPPSRRGKNRPDSDWSTPGEIIKQFQSTESNAEVITLMITEINAQVDCDRSLFILDKNWKPNLQSGRYGRFVCTYELTIKEDRVGTLLITRNSTPFLYRESLLIEWLQMLAISRLAEFSRATGPGRT